MSWMLRRFRRRAVLLPVLGLTIFFAGFIRDTVFNDSHLSPLTKTVFIAEPTTILIPGKQTPAIRKHKPPLDKTLVTVVEEIGLEAHQYRADGLILVNSNGAHPIFELIERAEMRWSTKLKHASRTFDEAVAEYERRYLRKPPAGFEAWWFYVEENNVQLPDEYDQIYHDLEPFWGMDPADLQRLQSEWEGHKDSYTLGKADGSSIEIVNLTLPEGNSRRLVLLEGAFEMMGLLEEVQDFIPPFRAVFSPHDNPNLPIDYELKSMALEAAAAGTYIDIKHPPPVKTEGWVAGCAPDSPARRVPLDLDTPPPPQVNKTFIYDHRLAMNPCLHPSHLHHHGQFLSHNNGPVPHRVLIPQFSYCVTTLHHDILPATPINWVEDVFPREDDPPWTDKVDERLLWRGSNTGIWHAPDTRWHGQQRIRLMEFTNELQGNVSILRSPKTERERVGELLERRRAMVNPAMMDVAFAGEEPFNCAEGVCEVLRDMFEWRGRQNLKKAGQYKYVLDVDGNGWSSRFKRLITSNSLVFKSTVYPEWYTDRIAPWVHYIPVQVDLSDLYDTLVFFRGDLNGDGAHDELASRIASAGRDWSKTFWRQEDLTAYMFRLFLEYARVMSPDRDAMSYTDWDPDVSW